MASSGWCIVNKPPGCTSFDVVRQVRRVYAVRRVGHTGTLDPLATGVLMVGVGQACKLIHYVNGWCKTYTFHIVWGQERTTGDAEGEVCYTSDVRPCESDLKRVLKDFCGEIDQAPPLFSAIKIKGQRAYDLARAGKQFSMQKRKVTIHSLDCMEHTCSYTALRVCCSAGTYVRSLAQDIARALGSYGYAAHLHREKVGDVRISDAVGYDTLLPLHSFWPSCYKREVSDHILNDLMHGRVVSYEGLHEEGPWLFCALGWKLPACVVRVENGALHSQRFLLSDTA